ncbi:hypothetical protein [Hymenobacter sp. BRD67]|uniref:hypothetical protein n=1 Tax=Hymenobacter sp. BRD67 TaxID=2675877 RepID=UPI001566BE42|nr:hypothetical protein [Hymenobacter sp. BRD67]QKG51947.1 hypothetical protein GKZ67_04140 [Hymenobacter sp. BRD67]
MKFLTTAQRGSALLALASLGLLASCNKSNESVQLSTPPLTVGKPVDNTAPIGGAIKGTMKQDLSFDVNADVIVNAGDTLVVQPGVKVNFLGNYNFVIKGTLLSLGTAAKPIWFAPKNLTHTDQVGADPATDPAYQGKWGGILGDVTCPLMVIKWTHVEGGGGTVVTSPVSAGIANNKNTYPIFFQNPQGVFDLEDSWVYGSTDDPIRILGGRINVMRNTWEKGGKTGGEYLNIKSGTTGNIAYNLFIGSATNGSKASNNGGKNPQTNIYMYNNTYIHNGYRRNSAGRGGSINYEEGSRGAYYNNIMVNCKYGPRVVGSGNYYGNVLVIADTANLKYGYNLNYVDSLAQANEIYPTAFLTKPQTTDIPLPSSFLPTGYKLGMVYNGSAVLGKNNPQFVGFPLPAPVKRLADVNTVGTYNFHLNSTSPAIGKGYTGFAPLATSPAIPVNANYGATAINPPNKDLGAYPTDGSGNQH